MKKVYVLLVVCLSVIASVNAQTYYWIGPSAGAGGNWNSTANWSFSPGGGSAGSFPNSNAHNVVFSQNALVNVNVANINLLTLTVNASITAKLFTSINTFIFLTSTDNTNIALRINTGGRLEDSAAADVAFTTNIANNSKAVVDGTWYFAGPASLPNLTGSNGATYYIPPVGTTRLDVNGTLHYRHNSLTFNVDGSQDFIFFNAGSTCWLDRNGGNTPAATWATTSTILISGVTSVVPIISFGTTLEVGNLVFNCPALAADAGLGLTNNLLIKGNFQILSTNARTVNIATNGGPTVNNFSYTVNGNFDVSGNSRVAIGLASNTSKIVDFQVNGNVNISGVAFDLQVAPSNRIVANPTTLKVKGNINHTAGLFGSASATTSTSNAVDLYVVELNGTSNQNISSVTGSLDIASNEITLLMNNAAGATLTTPVAVGKVSWNSAAKGKITSTTANPFTVNNLGTHALVINSASNTGFVSGPARRRTSSNSVDYIIPTGKGNIYDPARVRAANNSLSVFQAEYFNTAFGDLSFVAPLTGISNQEYWSATKISGADGQLALSLSAALPGAAAGDAVVIARYNGGDWIDYSMGGVAVVPGNSSTGTARTDFVALNGFYTFAYGVNGSLPINLVDFDARKITAGSAQVTWKISSNSNPDQFEVLRSLDGRNFSSIGTVKGVDFKYNYTFGDNALPTGTSYYRLKMTDKQGVITYSQIVAVLNGAKGVLLTSLIPTVVSSSATLTVSSSEKGMMQLMVTDMFGRIVKQQIAPIATGNQQIQLYLQALPAGAYQVTAIMNSNKVGTIRFVRQ